MIESIGLAKITTQMKKTLIGKTVENILLTQVKALNVPAETYVERTKGAKVRHLPCR